MKKASAKSLIFLSTLVFSYNSFAQELNNSSTANGAAAPPPSTAKGQQTASGTGNKSNQQQNSKRRRLRPLRRILRKAI